MISEELSIKVGIIDRCREVYGIFNLLFEVDGARQLQGKFSARMEHGQIVLTDSRGSDVIKAKEIECCSAAGGTFGLPSVAVGKEFHWERKEEQIFQGNLRLIARDDGTFAVVNEISVEHYLASVISSEMSGEAPVELLRAHAITSRSWLVAMLERKKRNRVDLASRAMQSEGELIRWYDREDHDIFDVCADDHCQRYQGITRLVSEGAQKAVEATRGIFLVSGEEICDARFSKACGGLTEEFENTWEDRHMPYLESISDSSMQHPKILSEPAAEDWILSNPDAYCNTSDAAVLRQILPPFDQETTNFFRWAVDYQREELEEIIRSKSGIDFGTLLNLEPLQRGPSGRIVRLRIEGSKKSMVVGKELEIRRWLSKTHLYSSAFVVMTEREGDGTPNHFLFYGAGWGHGVGLCQIGAAMMATKQFNAEEILRHYFTNAELKKLY
ncbi:MAG: SpoIID/LytB domain-containing protein [Bacteroidota bacterium]